MNYYRHHIFMCTNQRQDGRQCCADAGAVELRAHLKDRVKALGLSKPGRVRVNIAGCLDRCSLGPVMVVYPEGVWYRYKNREDLDEILDQHIQNGLVVERLRLPGHPAALANTPGNP